MVVLDELRDRDLEMALTEWNKLVEALRFDGEHEAFRDCVQVGASCWELEPLDAGSAEDCAERVGEQRVAVMDQVALAAQEAIDVVGQVASDLLDPRVVRMADQAGDVH